LKSGPPCAPWQSRLELTSSPWPWIKSTGKLDLVPPLFFAP
jgi:hypothetical protein